MPEPVAARALARWACPHQGGRGRRLAENLEADAPPRQYQVDHQRIVHSTAFRRLVYKTQVFINHEGDLFRTRLTHSLEVAQLGRAMARDLHLNEDLVEAIALAHDLGHTPFGHAGQDALHECMREHGGFEHNLQSLRVVDKLEEVFVDFDGLNLSFETREGILKHCSLANARRLQEREPGGVGWRFLHDERPSLEAQLVNLADEMAYNAHDIDDGVRSGLLGVEQLLQVDLFRRFHDEALRVHPQARPGRRLLFETTRRMLAAQHADVVATTGAALQAASPDNVDDVRRLPALVGFSAGMRADSGALKRLLFAALYRHEQVSENTARAARVVAELFAAYLACPQAMPAEYAAAACRERAVADYIAGMTDRFALREHHRLTGSTPFAAAA